MAADCALVVPLLLRSDREKVLQVVTKAGWGVRGLDRAHARGHPVGQTVRAHLLTGGVRSGKGSIAAKTAATKMIRPIKRQKLRQLGSSWKRSCWPGFRAK